MKIKILLLISLSIPAITFSQSFNGYRSGNYTGVNGVFFNPANIADSRFRWDVNLFGVNAGVANNTATFNFKTISKLNDDNIDSILLNGNKDKFSAAANIDILGPSFMFNASKNLSFALTTRFRTLVNAEDIDTKLIKSINDNTDDVAFPYNINSTNNQKIIGNGFADIGLSAAMVLSNSKQNFLKAGVSVKYLGGVSNNFININNINGTIDEDALPPNDLFLTDANGRIALGHGGVDLENADIGDILAFKSNGIGADIGFVYEYRPDYASKTERYDNKYKLKIGVALLDIGAIKYVKSSDQFNADYTLNVPGASKLYLKDFEDKNYDEIKTYMDNSPFFTNNATDNESYSVSLPTILQGNIDYNISGNFYADISGQFSVTKRTTNTNSYHPTSVTLTPRYEGKVFGVYLPLNYNSISSFNAGVGVKAGPLYFGSGSIINTLVSNSKQADFYIGMHVGMLHKPKKIQEQIIPPMPEPVDTVVVPKVIDSDNDGINDNEDQCPYIPGLAKYNGCPVPDTDSDGINDEEDKCPTVPGLAKYNGCPVPDTDNDGVNDEEDRCPTVPGIRENFGCPEIKEEIIKKVNFAASHLLFATGKSKILPASYTSMNLLVAILETDKALQLRIDGHTDNVGKPDKNQILSEARANAAKEYLVKKGIAAERIITTGYGDTSPVADNKTSKGRTKNRRIEMKVFN